MFKPKAIMFVKVYFRTSDIHLIPLFHTGPESNELTRIDKYLDSRLNRTQFVKILTDSHSPL